MSMNESRANRLQLNEMLYQQALVINELVSFRDLINNVLVTYNARVEKLGKIIAKK